MKTAEEMYHFCQDNGFFSGSDHQWSVRLFSVLENGGRGSDLLYRTAQSNVCYKE